MILIREMTPETIRLGTVASSVRTPSIRIRTRSSGRPAPSDAGLEVDVRRAALSGLGDDRVDELDDRRVVGRLAQVDDLQRPGALLVLVDRLLDRVLEAVHARDQRGDVLGRGDGGPDSSCGQQRDVVDREHVGRVGHREQQRAVVDVARPAPRRSAWPRDAVSRLAAAMSTLNTPRSRWSSP